MSFAVRTGLSPEEATEACRDFGLPGWRAVIRRSSAAADFMVALSSPDYCAVKLTGRIVIRYGRDAPDAFARAATAALALTPSTTH
jgi:hypothetical protein